MSGKNLVLLQRAKSGLEYYLGNFAKMQKKNPKFLVTTITRSEMVEFEWNFEAFGYIWVHLGKIFPRKIPEILKIYWYSHLD